MASSPSASASSIARTSSGTSRPPRIASASSARTPRGVPSTMMSAWTAQPRVSLASSTAEPISGPIGTGSTTTCQASPLEARPPRSKAWPSGSSCSSTSPSSASGTSTQSTAAPAFFPPPSGRSRSTFPSTSRRPHGSKASSSAAAAITRVTRSSRAVSAAFGISRPAPGRDTIGTAYTAPSAGRIPPFRDSQSPVRPDSSRPHDSEYDTVSIAPSRWIRRSGDPVSKSSASQGSSRLTAAGPR